MTSRLGLVDEESKKYAAAVIGSALRGMGRLDQSKSAREECRAR